MSLSEYHGRGRYHFDTTTAPPGEQSVTYNDHVSHRNIHLPEDQMDWLRREARRRRTSISAVVRWLIEEAREKQANASCPPVCGDGPTCRAEEAGGGQ